ncbi:hypothetical protein [Actinoplanes regularis]|uniref:hypothetical protein n=1 Tax=Actinoplanes regularis TaxID=52697 RepID=UPI0024A5F50A|nr:hypothetical protein [Actinoplanes regularis]GLW34506.1 hypothetical protein Areg01_74430 [Actinoplanes regularis]
MIMPQPGRDPAQHWLSRFAVERHPDRLRAKPLDEYAADARPVLAAGAAIDGPGASGSRDIVAISVQRAGVIADLLDELAERLRPGVEARPIRSAGELSGLARELAEDMYHRAT